MASNIAAVIVVWLVLAFVVMVLWGALALTFGATTIGYGTALLVVVAGRVLAAVMHGGLVGLGR